jgi:Domain of unknown function (DUF4389)
MPRGSKPEAGVDFLFQATANGRSALEAATFTDPLDEVAASDEETVQLPPLPHHSGVLVSVEPRPHYVVLVGLMVAAACVVIAGVFAVVFSRKYPVGLRNFLVGVSRYNLRLQAYAGLLNDQYPPFTLS